MFLLTIRSIGFVRSVVIAKFVWIENGRKMIIEETTTYAYKLKYIENVSFGRIRAFAQNFVNELPQELVDDIYDQLKRGLDLLQNEPQMLVYLYSFGKMHEAKLQYAFDQLPDAFRKQHKINIIDYGCGQAIGTMCYADFLRENGIKQSVGTITLIEPSEICLRRAALHAKAFFPDAEIRTVCKGFDDLEAADIQCNESTPTLHILSNVLDILDFDLERFAKLINGQLCGYNQFVCVGPYFNYSDKDNRMARFTKLINGKITYSNIFEKGELNTDKSWTAQIVCLSVGELEKELSTEVTEEDIENCIIEDECVYSKDGKRLLKCMYSQLNKYKIKNKTIVICSGAFDGCESLLQIIIPDSVTSIGKNPFTSCEILIKIQSTRFLFTKEGLLIDKEDNNIISYIGKEKIVTIPNSVTTIGEDAFWNCKSLQQIIIPDSVISIGFCAFGGCESLQQIIIPNSVTSIGKGPFYRCESLQQIIIPEGSEEKFKKMLPEELWDKLYER